MLRRTALALVLLLGASPAIAAPKLAVVDVQKVMESSPEWTKAVGNLKREFEKKASELEAKRGTIQKAKEQLDGKRSLVSNDQALAKEEDLLIEQIKKFRMEFMQAQQFFQYQENQLKDVMLARIEKVVYSLAAEGDYDYIFETGNEQVPNVLYSTKSIDLTSKVIKKYKAAFKGKALEIPRPGPRAPGPRAP